jgi:hypothetical protein
VQRTGQNAGTFAAVPPRGFFMRPRFKVIAAVGLLVLFPLAAQAQRGDECWDRMSSVHSDMIRQGFSPDGNTLEQRHCSAFNTRFRQMVERCDFNRYRQFGAELLRQNEVRFRQCQSARHDWCTAQLATDHKLFEARQSAYDVMDRWRSQCRAVD